MYNGGIVVFYIKTEFFLSGMENNAVNSLCHIQWQIKIRVLIWRDT